MRLPESWYDTLHARLAETMAETTDGPGLDALILDDPLDVAYVTGFVHFPNERPVVAFVPREGPVLLLVPDLEREYAADQRARAEIVVYPEFPGTRTPFEVLASAVSTLDNAGYAPSTSIGRVGQIKAAFQGTKWRVSDLVGTARQRKTPEEVALHREAARIADAMLAAGVELVRSSGQLPTETELAAHVTGFGTRMMYAEHDDVVVVPMLTGGLVYGGANSAQPHRMPGGDRLRHGEPFMLSLGCAVGGRFVESERTSSSASRHRSRGATTKSSSRRRRSGQPRCAPASRARKPTTSAWTSSGRPVSGITCGTGRATGSGSASTSRPGSPTATARSFSRA